MKHCILVKFDEQAGDWRDWLADIEAIFNETLRIDGVRGYRLIQGVTERPNRYHLMIEMDMTQDALPAYDASEPHQLWKSRYGARVAQKAIFDYETEGTSV